MRITARGWNRNMGLRTLANSKIEDIPLVTDDPQKTAFGGQYRTHVAPDEVNITWSGNHLNMTGNYRLDLHLSHNDIGQLFRIAFGEKISAEKLNELGIEIAGMEPSDAQIRSSIRGLSIGEFLEIIRPSSHAVPAPKDRSRGRAS